MLHEEGRGVRLLLTPEGSLGTGARKGDDSLKLTGETGGIGRPATMPRDQAVLARQPVRMRGVLCNGGEHTGSSSKGYLSTVND